MWGPIIYSLLRLVMFLSNFLFWPYSKVYSFTVKRRKVPPILNPLLRRSATELAVMIRERKISSSTVVQAFIERIQAVNPIINSVVQDRFEEALKEAKEADKMLEAQPDPKHWAKTKPLLGVPITVKESLAVKGMSNNSGRLRPKDHIARDDCDAVKNLRAAGGVVLAVTNTPELCFFWETYNYATGLTKNPHDTQKTAGGSSGGEAALLSSGGSVIGVGSDIAGSGRLPPMFCGVFGHKPTPRIIPISGHIPESTDPDWDKYLVLAPLARSAKDLSLIMKCGAADGAGSLRLDDPVDMKTLKVYYMEDAMSPLLPEMDSETKAAIKRAAMHFKKYGVEPKKVTIKDFDKALEASLAIMLNMDCPHNVFQRSDDPNDWTIWTVLGELLRKLFGFGRVALYSAIFCILRRYFEAYSEAKIDESRAYKQRLTKYFEELLGDNGVLILPVFPGSAYQHFRMYTKFLYPVYLCIFNLFEMPATACPMGFSKNGMPIGVQIAAYKYQDRLTLAVADELEEAFGGWVPPSSQPNCNMV